MTKEEFNNLQQGDVIRHMHAAESYVVYSNYLTHVTAVRSIDMTNPVEWDLVLKCHYDIPGRMET